MAQIWLKLRLYPETMWVPHYKAILQLPSLFLSIFEPSVEIIRGLFCCINVKCFVKDCIHSGCWEWYSFHERGIESWNFYIRWLIRILNCCFFGRSWIGKLSSGMSWHIVWEYGIVNMVQERISNGNHWLVILFCRW